MIICGKIMAGSRLSHQDINTTVSAAITYIFHSTLYNIKVEMHILTILQYILLVIILLLYCYWVTRWPSSGIFKCTYVTVLIYFCFVYDFFLFFLCLNVLLFFWIFSFMILYFDFVFFDFFVLFFFVYNTGYCRPSEG